MAKCELFYCRILRKRKYWKGYVPELRTLNIKTWLIHSEAAQRSLTMHRLKFELHCLHLLLSLASSCRLLVLSVLDITSRGHIGAIKDGCVDSFDISMSSV